MPAAGSSFLPHPNMADIRTGGGQRWAGLAVGLGLLLVTACTRAPTMPPSPVPAMPTTAVATSTPRPSATTALPTVTPVAPTAPAASATPTLPEPATATPTPLPPATPSSLSPGVEQAVQAFRALVAPNGTIPPERLTAARSALADVGIAFVNAGAVRNPRLQRELASQLAPAAETPASVVVSDLDGNGQPDLLLAVPIPGLVPLLFPDLQPRPVPIPEMPTAHDLTISRIVAVRAFPPTPFPFIVLSRTGEGASAVNTSILVVSWDGKALHTLFDQGISNWAGDAQWQLLPDGTIELTCPALGIYDHKLLPHPQQVRQYRWNGTGFVLTSRHTDPPRTRRQMMNLAEADFFSGDIAAAVRRYQQVISDSTLASEEGDAVDWVGFARFRLGEIAALRGDLAGAAAWLDQAAASAPPLGTTAAAFHRALQSGGPVAAFAAIQHGDLPERFARGDMGNLTFPISLAPFAALGEAVAYELNLQANTPTGAELARRLGQDGLQVKDVTVADLDHDGQAEIAMIFPLGDRVQTLWLFIRRNGRWQAIPTIEAPAGLQGVEALSATVTALRMRTPPGSTPSSVLLTWDGTALSQRASPTAPATPLPIGFQPSETNCVVAEDVPDQSPGTS